MKNFTDEKTLLREIKNGNGEAFEFLFNSYYPRLRGYAARPVADASNNSDRHSSPLRKEEMKWKQLLSDHVFPKISKNSPV